MTTDEFSNEFDVLIQPYLQDKQFGTVDKLSFDEYEKSVFLTKAQEDIILEYYSGKNPFGNSFEETEEVRRFLSNIVKEASLEKTGNNIYKSPDDLWFITYEKVVMGNCIKNIQVIPVTQDELNRILNNPFKGASDRRVLRLDIGDKIELISNKQIDSYTIRYISKPRPIILTDLTNGLSINEVTEQTECELNPAIHRTILNRAVTLALQSKSILNTK